MQPIVNDNMSSSVVLNGGIHLSILSMVIRREVTEEDAAEEHEVINFTNY